jgi:hypothetical protein
MLGAQSGTATAQAAGESAVAAPLASRYRRREPERTLLYATVCAHWKTFLADVEERGEAGASLPRFVVGEFERYLACGILAHGFARVRCTACGDELLVALSCKGRGFCPSCTARRMHDTAAHLVDRVIPRVPVRQWVLSLPRWARFLLARDPLLITRTLDIALRAIFAHQRRLARRAGALAPRTGAITFVQRFGGALNLNVNFHCIIPDGVFVRENGTVRFVALAPPSDHDVTAVLRPIVARLERLLRPRLAAAAADARPLDPLGTAQSEAMHSIGTAAPDTGRLKKRAAYLNGFSLHAAVHLHANDREGLAHLCGYGARPPFSQERLSALPDGRLSYRLKRPLGDGRQVLLLQPTELLRRLATLVPPPRAHLVRYHGVFAPASRWRSQVIPPLPVVTLSANEPPCPLAPAQSEAPAATATNAPAFDQATAEARRTADPSRIPWAELLMRVFREDVLACPCGGRRVVLAYLTQPGPVKAILDHLGLPSTGPPLIPARFIAGSAEAIWQDDVPVLQQSLR